MLVRATLPGIAYYLSAIIVGNAGRGRREERVNEVTFATDQIPYDSLDLLDAILTDSENEGIKGPDLDELKFLMDEYRDVFKIGNGPGTPVQILTHED